MFKNKMFILAVMSVFTAACSPTGGNTERVEMSDLVGLWNSSENNGANTDVLYTRITNDGEILEYDYDGDDVDQGLDCYQIDSGSIIPLDKNRFLVTADMHAGEKFKVELELLDNGHALKVYFLDSDDPSKTIKSQIWTREPDTSILDSEPPCRK